VALGCRHPWRSPNRASIDAATWAGRTRGGFYGYDAFGNLAFGTPTSAFGYSSQYTDPNTGLVNDRARFYQAQTGGFTTRDPAFSATDTAYAYAGDDPVNNSDPSGRDSGPDLDGALNALQDVIGSLFNGQGLTRSQYHAAIQGFLHVGKVLAPEAVRYVLGRPEMQGASPQRLGTAIHKAFEIGLFNLLGENDVCVFNLQAEGSIGGCDPTVSVAIEESYLAGRTTSYGTAGSVRPDYTLYNGDTALFSGPATLLAAYDLKTGSARVTTSQQNRYLANLPKGSRNNGWNPQLWEISVPVRSATTTSLCVLS
jgi:RHS repeat-associated protein